MTPAGAARVAVRPSRRAGRKLRQEDIRLTHSGRLIRYVRSNFRVLVAVGLVLTYIWRFHDFHPLFVALRLGAIFTVLSWTLLLLKPRFPVIASALKRPYGICLVAWTVWMGVGVPFSLRPDIAWEFFYDFHFKNFLLFLFLASTLSRLRNIHILILANIIGMAVGIYFYIKSGMPTVWTPYSMYDRNDLALLFNMTIPVAVWAGVSLREPWARGIAWGILLGAVASVIGTQSRGGLLALAISSLFLLARFQGVTRKAKIAFVGAIAIFLISAPDNYWDRMATILNPEDDYNVTSDTGRLEIWKRAIDYTRSKALFGVGANNFTVAETTLRERVVRVAGARGHVTHNSFLQVSSETGVPGFLFFVGMLGTAFLSLRKVKKRLQRTGLAEHAQIASLADLVSLCLIAYCVGGFFLSQGYFSYLMVLMAVIAGLQYVGERKLREGQLQRRSPPVSDGSGVPHPAWTGRPALPTR